MRKVFSSVTTAIFMHASVALADGNTLADLLSAGTVDMPITTAPASVLLGASGENVPRLSSFRAFSAQAARAFDEKGDVVNAVGVELAPALAMGKLTWEDIQNRASSRIWSRTTVSFATRVGDNDNGAQSAVGIQAVLYAPAMDEAIIRSAMDKCRTAAASLDAEEPPPLEPKPPKPMDEMVLKGIEDCQTDIDALLTKWNQHLVSVGAGRTFAASSDSTTPSPEDTSSIWLTAAFGGDFDDHEEGAETRNGYLITGHVRRTNDVLTVDKSGTEVDAKQNLYGINLRIGNARLAAIGEYSVVRSEASGSDFRDRKRSIIGLEYKVDDDMYLTLGVARDTGLDENKQSLLAKLNWGFSKKPTLLVGK